MENFNYITDLIKASDKVKGIPLVVEGAAAKAFKCDYFFRVLVNNGEKTALPVTVKITKSEGDEPYFTSMVNCLGQRVGFSMKENDDDSVSEIMMAIGWAVGLYKGIESTKAEK